MGDAFRPMQAADGCSAKPCPRLVRCVLLQHPLQSSPGKLIESFRSRGAEISIETEPVLALAALGAAIVEHRQQAARQSTFHATGESSTPHPSLILIVVEPALWDDLDELAGCIERIMPQVTVAVYSEQSGAGLEVRRRGRAAQPPAAERAEKAQPAGCARSARQSLRLADAPSPSSPRAEPIAASPFSEPASDDSQQEHEALITQAELAMLLGEDLGPEQAREERGP